MNSGRAVSFCGNSFCSTFSRLIVSCLSNAVAIAGMLAVGLHCGVLFGHGYDPESPGDSRSFNPEDVLAINRLVGAPQLAPDGQALAYITTDWKTDQAVRAHKPQGELRVIGLDPGEKHDTLYSQQAFDPVWARSGKYIAFFEGLGPNRRLVVKAYPQLETVVLDVAIAGEESSYSARHFPPMWIDNDSAIIVAEAIPARTDQPASTPFSQNSDTRLLLADAYFRDDTRWRIVRIDLTTGSTKHLSSAMALRQLQLSPGGSQLAITQADSGTEGRFIGDDWVQPLSFQVLETRHETGLRSVGGDELLTLLGWQGDHTLIAQTATGIVAVDIRDATLSTPDRAANPPEKSTEIQPLKKLSMAGSSVAPGAVAFWTHQQTSSSANYLAPPPVPHQLSVWRIDRGVAREVVSRAAGMEVLQAVWLDSGKQLAIHVRHLESLGEHLLLWDGNRLKTLLGGELHVGPLGAAWSQRKLVYSVQRSDQLPELNFLDVETGVQTVVTHSNQAFSDYPFSHSQLIESEPGAEPAWRARLYLPPSDRMNERTPLIVSSYIRQTDRLHQFDFEAQLHTAQGYAYLLPDIYPRRGELHSAYATIIPAVVNAVRSELTIGNQTGYYGGSLGGYSGLIALTHTGILDAAVLRAPPSEFALSWATGKDRDADLLEYLMQNQTPWQSPAAYLQDSPFWKADQVTAPTLFLHGAEDSQVPLAQSEWMFQALRRLGKAPAELRVYPGADHSIVRGNRAYFIDFYRQLFSWWERYLVDSASHE